MLQFELDQVNAFVLRKQHLTIDSKISDIPQIVEDVGGLHATGSISPYLSLLARHPDFKKQELGEQLYIRRSLAKIRCIRKTIYVHTKEMIPVVYAATRRIVEKASRDFMEFRGVSLEDYERIAKKILDLLAGQEMTAKAIKAALQITMDISSILYLMCDQGLLVRAKPEKGWRDKNQLYARFSDYFPDTILNRWSEQEAITFLVERYLAAFGPVTEEDVVWWMGLGKQRVRQALKELAIKYSYLTISGLEGVFLLLCTDEEPLQNTGSIEKPTINLLPALDPYLMGYKHRRRYLRPEDTPIAFDRSGNVTSTILVAGKIVGVWDFEDGDPPLIKLHFFRSLPGAIVEQIMSEALRLGEFIAEKSISVKLCASMLPLSERSAGAMISPLKGC